MAIALFSVERLFPLSLIVNQLVLHSSASEAWVTLATNDIYAVGALVLANSLRRAGSTRNKVILTTKGVTEGMR